MKKKITLIGINFHPEDTAIGLYSTDMMMFFAEKGYQVDVITGFPYYPQWKIHESYSTKPRFYNENLEGINIYRYKQYVPAKPNFFRRIIHLVDFTFGSFWNLLKIKETDLVIAIVPFTSSVLLGWILKIKCKAKLWVHVQDFEFDAALQTGVASEGKNPIKKLVFFSLFKIEKILFSKAEKLSSISFKMLEKLDSKTNNPEKITYIPNWIDLNKINPLNALEHQYFTSDKFKMLYSGNIGDKQDWNFFLNLVNKLDSEKFEVIIVGDGSKREWLLNKIYNNKLISYYPPVPYQELSNLLCSTDLHFLFQKKNVVDIVMPSKLLGMMASGKPSLVTGNEKSEVKKVLDESGGGYYIYKDEINEALEILDHLQANEEKRISIGEKARKYVKNNFTREEILGNMYFEVEKL